VVIVTNEPDLFELRNDVPVAEGEDPPTVLVEAGTWKTHTGNATGIAITTYGDLAALLSPNEARKLAKWLMKTAERLEGESRSKSRPGSKPSHYDLDDEAT
jgi:hypothetical protein